VRPYLTRLQAFDLLLLRALRTRAHAPIVEYAVIRFSRLGDHATFWLTLSCLGGLAGPQRRVYRRAGRTVVAMLALNYLTKLSIRRARPLLEDLPPLSPTTSSLSYPSAHASTSFAGARVLCHALPPGLVYGLAVGIGLSRPYLGIHYPSDVVAGAVFGTVVAGRIR
jgi:membrane-associated phospholipid phosphatase